MDIKFFEHELTTLTNIHSVDNYLNTPDFILAQFVVDYLESFKKATKERDDWCGFNTTLTTDTKVLK